VIKVTNYRIKLKNKSLVNVHLSLGVSDLMFICGSFDRQ
jgi:hypothetical protein